MKKQQQTKIVLIRHGETEWNQIGRSQGRSDVPLNERGRAQARAVAEGLAAERFDHVYASPLSRALETAQTIAAPHAGLEVKTDPALVEINLGALEGLRFDQMSAQHAGIMQQWMISPDTTVFPNGESAAEVRARVYPFIEELVRRHPGQRLLVVSHYFAIASILCQALGLPPNLVWRLQISNASVSILLYTERFGPRLALFNRLFWERDKLPGGPPAFMPDAD